MRPVLIQFPPAFGLPNPSPFCLKLETWLKMTGISYEVKIDSDPRRYPAGKLPALHYQGEMLGDTSLIIRQLRADFAPTLDDWLSPEQQAAAHALERMCENSLYWGMLYSRWIDRSNWPTLRDAFFSNVPPGIRQIASTRVRMTTQRDLLGQGLGNHSRETIYELCGRDLDALTLQLSDNSYLMGNEPSTVDACAFALLANIMLVPINSQLKTHALSYGNLRDYVDRMMQRYHPDFADGAQ